MPYHFLYGVFMYVLETLLLPPNNDYTYSRLYTYIYIRFHRWVVGGDSRNGGVFGTHTDPATSCRHLLNFHNFDFHIYMTPLYSRRTLI